MLPECLGERLATLHGMQHLAEDPLQLGVVGELGEGREASIEREARRYERGQLLGHDQKVAALYAPLGERAQLGQGDARRTGPHSVAGGDVDRDQPAIVQARDDRRHLGRLDRPLDDLPLCINCAVLELSHRNSSYPSPSTASPRG